VTVWGFETGELQITSLTGSAKFIYDGIHDAIRFRGLAATEICVSPLDRITFCTNAGLARENTAGKLKVFALSVS
jgi:hypothetical protein